MNTQLSPLNPYDEDKLSKSKIHKYKFKKIIDKKKLQKLSIHLNEVNKIGNEKNIIHKKIQLWTNDKGNEYAICLLFDSDLKIDNAQFIASTNSNENYIHPIAEPDNIEDLQHGWDYTLREVIEKYKKITIEKSAVTVFNPSN
ncbi:MAG TPA: hypothetical protein VIY98_10835 [Nitrososphaeraceae archaeon]